VGIDLKSGLLFGGLKEVGQMADYLSRKNGDNGRRHMWQNK